MRPIANLANLTALEDTNGAIPWIDVSSERELLNFTQAAAMGSSTMDTDVSGSCAANGSSGFIVGREGASLYGSSINYASPTYLRVGSANGGRIFLHSLGAMKGSFDYSGNYWTATWSWNGQPQLKYGGVSGWSPTNFAATIPVTMLNGATFVRRVDAVLWTPLGIVVVVGSYDFTFHLATQNFWLVKPSGNQYKLDTIIQWKFDEVYSNWYSANRKATFAAAAADSTRIIVVSNDAQRSLRFHIRGFVESQLEPVIPIDPDASNHSFFVTNIAQLGTNFLMSGRMTRPMTDNVPSIIECFLTSEDLLNWSIGEFSSFITDEDRYAGIATLYTTFNPTYIWAWGNGALYQAEIRTQDGGSAATNIDDDVIGVAIEQCSNVADQLTVNLLAYDDIPEVDPGRIINVSAGLTSDAGVQYGGQIGKYVVIEKSTPISVAGRGSFSVTGMDLGSWRLLNWAANTDIDRWSVAVSDDTLDLPSKVLIKTAQREVTFVSGAGLKSVALNNPFVGYNSTRDGRDGIAKATVRFTGNDQYSLSTFGFIYGGGDEAFNAIAIPRDNTWTGHQQRYAKALTSNLAPKDNENGTGGWTLENHMVGLWESVQSDPHPNAIYSGSAVQYSSNTTFTQNKDYQYTLRLQASKVQLYAREKTGLAATMVANSMNTLVYEWKANEFFKMRQDARSAWGFMVGTDVYADKTAFMQSEYGDMDIGLSKAANYADTGQYTSAYPYTGQKQADAASIRVMASTAGLTVGLWIRVLIPSWNNQIHVITSVNSDWIGISPGIAAGIPNGTSATIYLMGTGDYYGYADSGYSTFTDLDGITRIQDLGATVVNRKVYGRAGFISKDNSTFSPRFIETDGTRHNLRTGSPGTGTGWDATNPLASGAFGYSGSSPEGWDMVFHHGRFFDKSATTYGLPSGLSDKRYFIVDDEIIRYEDTTIKTRNGDVVECCIPTYYCALDSARENTYTLTQWHSGINYPGDAFNTIARLGGLLVEITRRSGDVLDDTEQYYATGTSTAGPPSTMTLNKPYPHALRALEAVSVVSGRGQLGTTKTIHDADAPVVYYPIDPSATEPMSELIRVKKFALRAGLYSSVEDDLKYTCALAGVRGVQFRSNGTYSGVLSTSQQTLNSDIQDFVLDMEAHLYTATDNRLRIRFRGNYLLDIRGYTDTTLRSAGRNGVVRIQLAAPNASITQGAADQKWIEQYDIHVSPNALMGSVTGDTYTEDATIKSKIRVVVKANDLYVEMDGQQLVAIDLKDYDYDSGSCYYNTSGSLTIQYTSSQAQSMTARVLELGDEVENHIIDMGMQGSEAVAFVRDERHILNRTTPSGSLEFSRFLARDDEGTLTANLKTAQPTLSPLDPIGHVLVSGAEFGEYVDASWVQANGYRFGMGQNRLLNTVSDSKREARTLIRAGKEDSKRDTITGIARIALQPEGKIARAITNSGDSPSLPLETFVLSRISLEISPQNGVFRGIYDLRKYYDF